MTIVILQSITSMELILYSFTILLITLQMTGDIVPLLSAGWMVCGYGTRIYLIRWIITTSGQRGSPALMVIVEVFPVMMWNLVLMIMHVRACMDTYVRTFTAIYCNSRGSRVKIDTKSLKLNFTYGLVRVLHFLSGASKQESQGGFYQILPVQNRGDNFSWKWYTVTYLGFVVKVLNFLTQFLS